MMTRSVKHLLHKHGDLNLDPYTHMKVRCNPSTWAQHKQTQGTHSPDML